MTETPPPGDADRLPAVSFRHLFAPDVRALMVAVLASTAMNSFEGIGVGTVLPDIGEDLGRVDLIGWVVTAYLIPSAVVGVAAGGLVDNIGARTTFRLGLVGFTVSSVLAVFAPNMGVLLALRVLQGAASGATVSAGLSSIGLELPEQLRPRALASCSTVWGVMGAVGPLVGAVMASTVGWRGIFAAIVPFCAIGAFYGWNSFPGPATTADDDAAAVAGAGTVSGRSILAQTDLVGLGLLTVVTVALVGGLSTISWSSLIALAVATVALGALVSWLRRTPEPLFDPNAVFSRRYRVANLAPVGVFLALGVQSFAALYVRVGAGQSAGVAAFSLLWTTIGWTTGANVTSRLLDRFDELLVIRNAYVMMFAGLVTVALSSPAALLPVVFAGLFLTGLGVGSTTNAAFLLLQRRASDAEMGRVTSIHQYLRAAAMTLGVAIAGAVIFFTVNRRVGSVEAVREALSDDDIDVSPDTVDAMADAFANAAWVGAGVIVVGLVGVTRRRRNLAAEEAAKHRNLLPGEPVS
jgi:MFS family permease